MRTASTELHGFLNLLKPPALTSNDVVSRVRQLSGVRRVGHAGTLDPAAVGVLPIGLGRATRFLAAPAFDCKLYWADVFFGARTTTDDAEGEVLEDASSAGLSFDAILGALKNFTGDYDQAPPTVSALHVGGERAYVRARRNPLAVEPPARRVRVDAIELLEWRPPRLSLLVACRSGTYIRSIARDLGAAVHCPAHLYALVRLRVGPFEIREALDLDEIRVVAATQRWEEVLIPVDMIEQRSPVLIVDDSIRPDYAAGRSWDAGSGILDAFGFAYGLDGNWLGYAGQTADGTLQSRRAPDFDAAVQAPF